MTKKIDKDQPTGYKYKYKRLYSLGADRMGIIDSMLTNGESTLSVAERIKVDWGECGAVKIMTLDRQIHRYRKDILEPRLAIAAENAIADGVSISKGMKKFRDTVDVMDKLTEYINMQGTRIQKAFTKEDLKGKEGKLDQNISRELRVLTDMCKVLAGLQLETGVVRRVPRQVQGFFQQLDSNELQEFRIEMTQNDDTLKALATLKDVIQEAASEIIDGEYIPVASQLESISEVDDAVMGSETS